jgi:hypothetical protein
MRFGAAGQCAVCERCRATNVDIRALSWRSARMSVRRQRADIVVVLPKGHPIKARGKMINVPTD